MKSIGFNNFRKFEKFSPIQLGDITFFVGGNNAGKSTAVKAMMLMLDNLSNKMSYNQSRLFEIPSFRLDANRIHEVHIGTFGRALHKPNPEKKEFSIESGFDNFNIKISVTGDSGTTQANADISKIEVVNIENNVKYSFDFQSREVIVSFNTSVLRKFNVDVDEKLPAEYYLGRGGRYLPLVETDVEAQKELLPLLQKMQDEKAALQSELKTSGLSPQEIANINNKIRGLNKDIDKINDRLDPFQRDLKIEDVEYKYPINIAHGMGLGNFVSSLIMGICENLVELPDTPYEQVKGSNSKGKKLTKKDWAFYAMLSSDARKLAFDVRSNRIEYIAAHAAAQKVLFSIEDKNDYMASVIRDFMQCRITHTERDGAFISKWMKEFGIGLDYNISSIAGEAYTMDITNLNGDDPIPLADLGMGSIQLMLLLLRLATIIHTYRGSSCIIIIEEPEQNIHPKLQSKLADLIADVNRAAGFKFVIETHSEYLIRRTQAMIAKGDVNFENNPFKVYYFPEEGEPYDMVYQKTGMFENNFDEGFFDEATRQHMHVIINAQKKQ